LRVIKKKKRRYLWVGEDLEDDFVGLGVNE